MDTIEQLDELTDAPADEKHQADADAAVVEAVLFTGDAPLAAAKIAAATELPPRRIKQAVERLNERYTRGGHAFRVEELAGGYRMMTLPEFHDVLGRLLNVKKESRLSQAALETLAIVAYRQPILRADLEAIRGVASGEVLRGLLERQLVKIVGRAEVIGRPMLYGTSRRFLEVFGLANLDDLPRVEELRSGAEAPPPAAPSSESPITPKDEKGSSESGSTRIEADTMSMKKPDDAHLPDPEDMNEEEEDELLDDFDVEEEEDLGDEDDDFEDEDEEEDEEDFDDDEDFDEEEDEEFDDEEEADEEE
ncbi:MAG: SMC-Scp complex subunit ScpB [Phycisphaerae bacterium]|nr:SMC-Scp complex subunit ScpB [Phycisphaerae bacterium]